VKQRAVMGFGIVLSIVLLIYALRDISPSELLYHFRQAHVWLLIAATVASTFTFALRAIRWRLLLAPAAGALPFSSRWATVNIGFMTNNLLPARIGEFARAYSLSRVEPVTVSAALASLVVERLFDSVIMLGLLVPAYVALGAEELAQIGPLRALVLGLIALVAVGVVVLGLTVRFPDRVLGIVDHLSGRLPARFTRPARRLRDMLESFIGGLGALRHGHVIAKVFAWSLVVWLWNAFSFYLGFLAFDIVEPGFTGAMFVQGVIGPFVALPSSPGFFGPFEAAARLSLEMYAIEPSKIVSFAVTYHILTFLPVTVLGIWYMRKLGIRRAEFSGGVADEAAP